MRVEAVRRAMRQAVLWGFGCGLLAVAALFLGLSLYVQWQGGAHALSPLDRSMPEADFSNLWTAGRLARAHRIDLLYDGPGFQAVRARLFGGPVDRLDWIYPPTVLLPAAAFSLPPLLPGFLFWQAAVAGGACWALRRAGVPWAVVALGLLSPASLRGFALGQIAPLVGALTYAGLLRADDAPAASGAMLGLATLKPQLGVLAPVLLLVRRQWRAVAWAACMAAALALLATACFGTAGWALFLRDGCPDTRRLLQAAFPRGYPANAASVFWTARAWGAPLGVAWIAQGVAAAAAAAAAALAARLPDAARRAGVVCCLCPLVSPYLYESDLVAVAFALGWAMRQAGPVARPLLFWLWVWPGLSDAGVAFGLRPMLPLCCAAAAYAIWRGGAPVRTGPAPCRAAPLPGTGS